MSHEMMEVLKFHSLCLHSPGRILKKFKNKISLTALAAYIWNLKDIKVSYTYAIRWSIIDRGLQSHHHHLQAVLVGEALHPLPSRYSDTQQSVGNFYKVSPRGEVAACQC